MDGTPSCPVGSMSDSVIVKKLPVGWDSLGSETHVHTQRVSKQRSWWQAQRVRLKVLISIKWSQCPSHSSQLSWLVTLPDSMGWNDNSLLRKDSKTMVSTPLGNLNNSWIYRSWVRPHGFPKKTKLLKKLGQLKLRKEVAWPLALGPWARPVPSAFQVSHGCVSCEQWKEPEGWGEFFSRWFYLGTAQCLLNILFKQNNYPFAMSFQGFSVGLIFATAFP